MAMPVSVLQGVARARAWASHGPLLAVLALFVLFPNAAAASEPTVGEAAFNLVPGTPGIGARAGGSGLAFSPNGKLLAQGTEILSVSATTAPSPVGGPPPDPNAEAVAFSPSGRLLAAADVSHASGPGEGHGDTVSMFSVGRSGALTPVPGSPFTANLPPGSVGRSSSITFSPNGTLLALIAEEQNGEGSSIYLFSVSASGVLTPVAGSPYSVPAEYVAFNPTGSLLAAEISKFNKSERQIRMFSVGSSGALTEVSGSPFNVPEIEPGGAIGLAFTPTGHLIAGFGVTLLTYSVGSSGALEAPTISSGAEGRGPLVLSPDGNMLAVPKLNSPYVGLLSVGPSGVPVFPGSLYYTGAGSGSIAFSSGGLLAANSAVLAPSSLLSGASSLGGRDWLGALGDEGYDLPARDGESDVSYLPQASVALTKGTRCPGPFSEEGLPGPDGSAGRVASYCNLTTNPAGTTLLEEAEVVLTFRKAYKGDLRVYSKLQDETIHNRGDELMGKITINGTTFGLTDVSGLGLFNFGMGEWFLVPVSEPAGGKVTISGTFISGIFLGDGGPPPAMPVSRSPQGNWRGTYGSAGYDLAAFDGENDLVSLPSETVTLQQGARQVWASSTHDERALQAPKGHARTAAAYDDPNQIRLLLKFNTAFSGDLHLYAVDWDSHERRELISVDGQTADLSHSFHDGAWVKFPISVAAGESVPIVVDRTAGESAVLSGMFLGGGGAPPR